MRRMKRNLFDYSGGALIMLSGAILLFGGTVGINPLWGFVTYAVGVMVLVLTDVGGAVGQLDIGSLMALFGLYTVLAFWDFIFIILVLPAIFIDMILGPFAWMTAILAILMLGIYVIEDIFHHDLAGVSGLESGKAALVTLGIAVVALVVGIWYVQQDDNDNTIADRMARLSERVRGSLLDAAENIRD